MLVSECKLTKNFIMSSEIILRASSHTDDSLDDLRPYHLSRVTSIENVLIYVTCTVAG
jgi:hypothetical protein